VFDSLSDKLQAAFDGLKRQGKLTDKDVERAARELRLALLEADVNFKVVKQFVDAVKNRALGSEVLESLTPAQQFVKIVNEELTTLMGSASTKLTFSPRPPTLVMMVGLQGSGKTTACGKLANFLLQQGKSPALAAGDVYRPAAIDQLKSIGDQLGVPVYDEGNKADPVHIAKNAVDWARNKGRDVLIIDTAGRLHVDETLMDELVHIRHAVKPHNILLVLDAMTGQDAVNVALAFQERVDFDGVVLTKMDGDARGGAALSIRQVTGQPIKFIGVGEKYDALEPFHPDRIVSRILGMGDILSLIERAEQQIDKKKAEEIATKALSGDGFSLEDFRDQLRQVRKMGSIQNLMGMLPSIGPFAGLQKHADKVDEGQLNRVEAIINSMTVYERNHHESINGSRRKRIARGSGTTVQEVNNLLRQYAQMRKMFKQMGKASFGRRLAGMKLPGM